MIPDPSLPGWSIAPLAVGLVLGVFATFLPLFFACYVFLQRFATKSALEALEARQDHRHAEQQAAMIHLENRFTTALDRHSAGSAQRSEIIATEVRTLTTTMQLFTNEMNRVVGAIEGEMGMLKRKEGAHGV